MKVSKRKGFSFGLVTGIITTLGLIVGLHSSTQSVLAITGGILVIAIADGLSDSLAMHISEESENRHTTKEIWESTFYTFLSKIVFTLSFIIPIALLPLGLAIVASIVWGLFLISAFSYHTAKKEGINPYKATLEHLAIAILVIIATHYIGLLASLIKL